MNSDNRLWAQAIAFAIGAVIYIGLYIWIVVLTFQASNSQPAIPGYLAGIALTLSAAVGGFLARFLGVQPPSSTRPQPFYKVTPNDLVNWVILIVSLAYVLIGVACFVADAKLQFNTQVVPAVVAAQWKVVLGLFVASFARVFASQGPAAASAKQFAGVTGKGAAG